MKTQNDNEPKTESENTESDTGCPPPPCSAIRPSRLEQGVLLAARWLVEYGEPTVAAYMLRDYGLDRCDLRKMEEQDIEILATLNITDGTHFILPSNQTNNTP